MIAGLDTLNTAVPHPQFVILFYPEAARAGLGAITTGSECHPGEHSIATSQKRQQHKVCSKQLSDVSIFISCVGKLATKVDEWSKITTDPWILESVRAYHLEFKTKPIQISPPLQPSRSEGECKLIQREIDSLLLKGAITVAQHSKDEFLSNIFLVPKKTGDLRPVINLKPLNEFVHDIHFKMENIC